MRLMRKYEVRRMRQDQDGLARFGLTGQVENE